MTQHSSVQRIAATLALCAGFLAACFAQDSTVTLKVGDSAPAMRVASWVKGEPVRKFEPGMVYVVAFWGSWSDASRLSIPPLTAMAKKFAGKAVFMGIGVGENSDTSNPVDQIDQVISEMGPKLGYAIGVDGSEQPMAKTWMEAAGQTHIPSAFVVDQHGKIAWIGHPMMGLEEVVGRVIEGKFDAVAEARAQAAAEEAARQAHIQEAAAAQSTEKILDPARKAIKQHRFGDAAKALVKAIGANPALKDDIAIEGYGLLLESDEPTAYSFAKEIAAGPFKTNPTILNELAWRIVDDEAELKKPNYPLAVSLAQKAVDATKPTDPTLPGTLDTLGYALFKAGQLDKAIEVQARAISVLSVAGELLSEGDRHEITARLALFKAKKRGC